MNGQTTTRRRFGRRPAEPLTLPPLPFPDAPNPNVRYTLRGITHPKAPRSLPSAMAWSYRNFAPPDGQDAFVAEIDALLAEHDEVLANEGTDPDPFFTGFLDEFVEETLDAGLPPSLSGRTILEGMRVVAQAQRGRRRRAGR